MNKFQSELVTALRSNKYKQGKRQLRSGDSFCCLGVACDIKDDKMWSGNNYIREDFGEVTLYETFPPADIIEELGGRTIVTELAKMNDRGKTFEQIADYIERYDEHC